MKAKIAQNNSQVSEGGITVKPGQSFHSWIAYLKSKPVCRFCNIKLHSNEFLTATFQQTMRWKIFQWKKFLFRHSLNSRKLSRQKFYNELACVLTAHYASKNADWNQQQLREGGILANWNSANHPYCFLSNQKKVQILAFLHVIRQRNVSCPLPVRDLKG